MGQEQAHDVGQEQAHDAGEADTGEAPPTDQEAAPAPEESADFGDFMADLGATAVSADESRLAIRDATIAELRSNLEALRPLGDQLAETEKARLALASELAEQQVELAHEIEAHHAERLKLETAHRRAESRRKRVEERLRKVRAKLDQRDAAATERWHKIRALQAELKALRQEVKRLTERPAASPDAAPSTGERDGHLARLFDPEPGADPADRAADARQAPEPVKQERPD